MLSASEPRLHRRARIVATLGPASRDRGTLRHLLTAGVDVVRLNFSHGTHADHAALIADTRAAAASLAWPVAILQDLQGPKIRTGPLAGGVPVHLTLGQEFIITTRPVPGDAKAVSTTYAGLPHDVQPGARVLLSDGLIELRVLAVEGLDVVTAVVTGGLLSEHQGINLPGVAVSAPALTEKDRTDLAFGLEHGVDYVALSFVRSPADIVPVREIMSAHGVSVPVIAKIEKPEALAQLDDVLRAFDGVMVARGDLGVELSPEAVPVWQQKIIRRANALGKPVIVATQMLESMINHPRPTRAEASDVANAVFDGTDALMLSGETAVGHHPIVTVETMARIILAAESVERELVRDAHAPSTDHAIARAACGLAQDLDAAAVVVLTQSGRTAQLVSKERPAQPIIALTGSDAVARQLALWWGVVPLVTPLRPSAEAMLAALDGILTAKGLAQPGDTIVVTGSTPLAAQGRTNFIKVQRLARPRRRKAT